MTGAEWIKTRFGTGTGATLSHIVVVIFALVSVIGFLSYGFKGIGKFTTSFLPPLVSNVETLAKYPQINENLYALILMAITTFYVVKGGMFSVVITEVIQYGILTIAAVAIGIIAIYHVSPDALECSYSGRLEKRLVWLACGTRLEQSFRCGVAKTNCI